MKKYNPYLIMSVVFLGIVSTFITWFQITKVKNEVRSQIEKITTTALESLTQLETLSKEKSNFTKKNLYLNTNFLEKIQKDLQVLEETSLKSQENFEKWEKSLSAVNSLVAEFIIHEIKHENKNEIKPGYEPKKQLESTELIKLIRTIEAFDQKLESSILSYETQWIKREALIEKYNQIPFSKKGLFHNLPNSLVYQKYLQPNPLSKTGSDSVKSVQTQ